MNYESTKPREVSPVPGVFLERTADHIHLRLQEPRQVLSSAVLGGGWGQVSHLLNLKVAADPGNGGQLTPQQALQDYASQHGWQGPLVGMMTAAAMGSLRMVRVEQADLELAVLVTSGLANARRAGDRAEYRHLKAAVAEVGTINIVLLCSARLSPAAMVEASMMITEAKAAALQQRQILSPVSGQLATGTGTDAVAIINGIGALDNSSAGVIEYCGKHTLLGEYLARATIAALTDSFDY